MRAGSASLLVACLAGCGVGEVGASLPGSISIRAPSPGSVWIRDSLDRFGALSAAVEVEVETGGRVAAVRLEDETGAVLGVAEGSSSAFTAHLTRDGRQTIVAVALGGDDQAIATAEVEVEVEPPAASGCHDWLDLYQLDYEIGPERQGVSEPVTVTTPLNGVIHRYVSNEEPRESFFMDCELALSLARAASHLRRRDLTEMVDIGVYNYRCIGGEGTPPDCPRGVSWHAYAKAIDIAGVTAGDGTYYSVNDDWVIDPEADPTCEAGAEGEKDALLHELICGLKAAGVWNIVLTPNYNTAHRNHFHVDLTTDADFIRKTGAPAVDVGPDHH